MTVVGVPEITPVELEIVRPDGRVGDTSQVTTVPPVDVGVAGLGIAAPLVRV